MAPICAVARTLRRLRNIVRFMLQHPEGHSGLNHNSECPQPIAEYLVQVLVPPNLAPCYCTWVAAMMAQVHGPLPPMSETRMEL